MIGEGIVNKEMEFNDDVEVIMEIEALRHGKKLGTEPDDEKDAYIPLKPMGKLQALCKSLEMEDSEHIMTVGSPKLRAQQTTEIISHSSEIFGVIAELFNLEITEIPNILNGILEKLLNNKEKALTKKEQSILGYVASLELSDLTEGMDSDPRLGFHDGNEPAKSESNYAFDHGKGIVWMIENSDRRAIETQDYDMTTYTRHAANMASLLKDYFPIAKDTRQMIIDEPGQFEKRKSGNQYEFKQILGTHTGVNECFLLKAVEIMERNGQVPEGIGKEILDMIPNGVKETEGLRYQITESKNGHKLEVFLPESFAPKSGNKFEISDELLDEIIRQGEDYENNFEWIK